MELNGKIALITGGAKGIGLATGQTFAQTGAQVILLDRDARAGEAAQEAIGKNALFIETDVARSSELQKAIDQGAAHFGGIDFLINNAGIVKYATAENCSEADWDEIMNINLKAAFLGSKFSIPHMRRRGGGVIINVASAQAFISSSNMVHYTTAKSALLGFTRSLAIDFAPSIRAIAVCPGTVDTPMAHNAWATSKNPESVRQDSIAMHLLKRICTPQEVAELIVFLCSNKSAFITGQAIRIDGGLGISVPGSVNDET